MFSHQLDTANEEIRGSNKLKPGKLITVVIFSAPCEVSEKSKKDRGKKAKCQNNLGKEKRKKCLSLFNCDEALFLEPLASFLLVFFLGCLSLYVQSNAVK